MAPTEVPIKLVVVGGARSGKSCAVAQFKKKVFQTAYNPTVGFNINTFQLTKKPKGRPLDISLHIWDVSFAELNGRHLATIFGEASGVLLVTDPTNAKSLEALDKWVTATRKHIVDHAIPIVLAITKCDLCRQPTPTSTASLIASSLSLTSGSLTKLFGVGGSRSSSAAKDVELESKAKRPPALRDLSREKFEEVVREYCKCSGIRDWYLCSAKTGKNVRDMFYSLVNLALEPALEAQRLRRAQLSAFESNVARPRGIFDQPIESIPRYSERRTVRGPVDRAAGGTRSDTKKLSDSTTL